MNRVSPQKYWKDREIEKRRKLPLVVRQDRYVVDEQNRIILKDFDLEVGFAGRSRWRRKQGRLEIRYDETRNAWYASIPVEVGVEETKTGKKSEHIARGERESTQIESPEGNKAASIDLRIDVLASVVVNDGTWLLYKGLRTKEDYFYFEKKIAQVQSLVDKTENVGKYEGCAELSREKTRLFKKLTRRLLHLCRNFASHLVKELHDLGVSTIYLGYPFNIAQDKGNEFT